MNRIKSNRTTQYLRGKNLPNGIGKIHGGSQPHNLNPLYDLKSTKRNQKQNMCIQSILRKHPVSSEDEAQRSFTQSLQTYNPGYRLQIQQTMLSKLNRINMAAFSTKQIKPDFLRSLKQFFVLRTTYTQQLKSLK
ncbi:hypothetical protein LguiA_034116 [Lonicera macranthoides]